MPSLVLTLSVVTAICPDHTALLLHQSTGLPQSPQCLPDWNLWPQQTSPWDGMQLKLPRVMGNGGLAFRQWGQLLKSKAQLTKV